MKKPKCFNSGILCPIHKDGKYKKWSCGEVYNPVERHNRFISTKHKCKNCKKLCTAEYCQKCRGLFHSSPLLGKKLPKWWCKLISDGQGKQEESPMWKGENASYSTKHKWIVHFYGNPKICSDCGVIGKMGKRTWNIQWANISGEYKRDVLDYKGLCPKCHMKLDKVKVLYPCGTNGKYREGCRCELCLRAKSLYRQGLISFSSRVF